MASYKFYTMILSFVQVVLIAIGHVYIGTGGHLTCTGGGYEWLYSSLGG